MFLKSIKEILLHVIDITKLVILKYIKYFYIKNNVFILEFQ